MKTTNTEELKQNGDFAKTLVWYIQHANSTEEAEEHVRRFLSTKINQALAEDREKVRGEIKKLDNYKMTKPWSGIVETFIVKSDLLSSLDKPLPDKLTKK